MSFEITVVGGNSFEDLKQTNQHGAEFWSARNLQILLGYKQWRRFEDAIKRAKVSCNKSGNAVENHFADAGKMVEIGSETKRELADYHLSRFACYLIAQNGDSGKEEIAHAQRYFAIQTRRQEVSDQLLSDMERLETRQQTASEFKALSSAAKDAGVQDQMFGVFHDAGYKGLYGGKGRKAIQKAKGIPDSENIMDRMDTTELAANQFRMTQTREKLKSEGIYGQQKAIDIHQAVGQEVREAIKRIGGAMPEKIPAAEHIKSVKKRVETTAPKLRLEEKDAKGLTGNLDTNHTNKP